LIYSLIMLLACAGNGNSDTAGEALDDSCGDLDAGGSDTGDMPSLQGDWSLYFGDDAWWDDCDISDFGRGSERWLDGTFSITGQVPDRFHATLDGDEFGGLQEPGGGVIFTGTRIDKDLGAVTVSFGGHPYTDVYRDVEIIEGFGFLGIDQDQDGIQDCEVRADFEARKIAPIECGTADADRGTDGPNVLGRWTMTVGNDRWDDNCGLSNFGVGTESWLSGSLEVEGRLPGQLYVDIDDTGTRLYGAVDNQNRFIFGGIREDPDHGAMVVSFGGVILDDLDLGRKRIDGYTFIGLDVLGDGEIDCYTRADFQALKSGA
jgi:hypothetical protein